MNDDLIRNEAELPLPLIEYTGTPWRRSLYLPDVRQPLDIEYSAVLVVWRRDWDQLADSLRAAWRRIEELEAKLR